MTGTIRHFHLVSDASGETIRSVARACFAQFEGIERVEHGWSLVRGRKQLETVIRGIESEPGMVLYTLVDPSIRDSLKAACHALGLPCISILDPVIEALGQHLGRATLARPGRQHQLDSAYFDRMEAMDFALATDDGQREQALGEADVILVGVSRTSKTPTCLYLANQGLKAANIPYVPGIPLPEALLALGSRNGPLIVGLTKDPKRLVQIRRSRLRLLNQNGKTDYIDPEQVAEEVRTARLLFARHGWPVIDVTRRSIEETAAAIMQILARKADHAGGRPVS